MPEPEAAGAAGLGPLDRVVLASGLLLFASAFLPWFTYALDGGGIFRDIDSSVSGWRVGLGWAGLPALLGLGQAALVLVQLGRDEPLPLPSTQGRRDLLAGGVAGAIVTLKLLVGHHHGVYDVSRAFGLYVATLAALVLAGAGFVRHRGEQAPSAATTDR